MDDLTEKDVMKDVAKEKNKVSCRAELFKSRKVNRKPDPLSLIQYRFIYLATAYL